MKGLRRVAITGLGTISGMGHNLEESWKNIREGQSGVSQIESIETEHLAVKIAGEVKNFEIDPEIMDPKETGRNDRFLHFSLKASHEALHDAGIATDLPYPAERVGCLMGVGMGGFPMIQSTAKNYFDRGARRVSPFFIPAVIPNMASGLNTIKFGQKGVNYTISSACASSSHAIGAAAFEIMLGRQDIVLTGGAEAVLCDLAIVGFANMKALSKNNENPTTASRPFDEGRDGFIMGEGAAALVLEDYEKAKARGAKIYAELVGFGASSDAHHITAPQPEGLGAIQCMKQALETSGVEAKEVGYINAHGTSTPLGDVAETQAIKNVFGGHAHQLNVSSTKSMTGHLLGAAGAIEALWCTKALQEQVIPPTINLQNQDPNCDLNYTANAAVEKSFEFALSNSFGFGGTNACLILKKA